MADGQYVDTIVQKVFTPDVMIEVAQQLNAECGRLATERRARKVTVQAQLADVRRRKAKLFEVLELKGREAPHLGDLTQRLRDLTVQADALGRRLFEIDAEPLPSFSADAHDLASIREVLSELVSDRSNVRHTRTLLQNLLSDVVIDSDRAQISYRTSLLADNGLQRVSVHSGKNWLPE